ncbi:MAG: hypothetical protein JST40_08545 [Armatimonadetes bacterium]|nr:hypothetical protein [Armatimonadota bacterium]
MLNRDPEVDGLVRRAFDSCSMDERYVTVAFGVRESQGWVWSGIGADRLIYPASVVKMYFLVYALMRCHWLQLSSGGLHHALREMIQVSDNDATNHVLDLMTGTTGGPPVPDDEWPDFFARRWQVTEFFRRRGYDQIVCMHKTFGHAAYGREAQIRGVSKCRRNALSGYHSIRLLAELWESASGVSELWPKVVAERALEILWRTPGGPIFGSAFADASGYWSKSGNTSEVHHDCALIELPECPMMALAVFTHGTDPGTIHRDLAIAIRRELCA